MAENRRKEDQTQEYAPVRSFRVNDDIMGKFNDICNELGTSKQEALASLISTFEFAKASSSPALADDQERTKKFREIILLIQQMYLDVLQEKCLMKDTVRTNFEALLRSKDNRIVELEKKCEAAKEEAATAKSDLEAAYDKYYKLKKDYEAEAASYFNRIEQLKEEMHTKTSGLENLVTEKSYTNQVLSDNIEHLKKEVEQYKRQEQEQEDTKELLLSREKELAELKKELQKKEAELAEKDRVMEQEKKDQALRIKELEIKYRSEALERETRIRQELWKQFTAHASDANKAK